METRKINVCHIVTGDLWAGAEAQAYASIKALSQRGSVQLSAILFNEGELARKLSSAGIPIDLVDEKRDGALEIGRKIAEVLKRRRVELVHTHGYKETLLGGAAARLCRVRGIVRTHHGKGVVDGGVRHRAIEKVNGLLFSDRLISVSEDLKRVLVAFGLGGKITVIRNGVFPEDIKPSRSVDDVRRELKIGPESRVVGTLGRMVSVKGHRYLLEGAKTVLAQRKEVVFVIAGDGPLMEEILREAGRSGIESGFRMIGFRKDPFDIINMFDIFAMTSLHEGIPIALLEAMCLEKPIIATRVGGIPEIISDRWNGLLIAPMNGGEFASACLKLIEDRPLRETLASNARRDLIDKHHIERAAEETERLYRGMI